MNKYMKGCLILASSLLLVSCGKVEKQEVSEIKVDSVKQSKKEDKKENKKEDKKEIIPEEEKTEVEVVEEKDETTNQKNQSQEEITGTIDDRISTISTKINSLHSFDQPYGSTYNDFVELMSKHGISVEESVKGPYGLYDTSEGIKPSVVLSGISNGVSTTKTDFGYEIVINSRTGIAQFVDSVSHTASAIKSEIRKSDYQSSEKEVKYHLSVSEDRNSATLTRVSEQWW